MKKIELRRLEMVNFRGFANQTVDFGKGITHISGGNGVGKSTIHNAFLWLLFGKDNEDRKDYEVKHLIDGKSQARADVVVRGTLLVDGNEVVLERRMVEQWVKPRGASEEVYKGNATSYLYNEVPLTMREYDERVGALLPLRLFKLLSLPEYFMQMGWREQRDLLFELVDIPDDKRLADGDAELEALLSRLGGKTLDDYKRELKSKRNKVKAEAEGIAPRIDQTIKMKPEAMDWGSLEGLLLRLEAERDRLRTRLRSAKAEVEEAKRKAMEGVKAYEQALHASRELKRLHDERCDSAYIKALREREEGDRLLRELEAKGATLGGDIKALREACGRLERRRDVLEEDMSKKRQRWAEVSNKPWEGSPVCVTCGQALSESNIARAKELHRQGIKVQLDRINREGRELKAEQEEVIKELERTQREIEIIEAKQREVVAELEAERGRLAVLPPVVREGKSEAELASEREAEARVEEARARMVVVEEVTDAETAGELERVEQEIEGVRRDLAKRDEIARYEQEVETLESKGRELSATMASLEGELDLVERFTSRKVEITEELASKMFEHLSFRLYERTLEGGLVEVCVCLIDGVPYPVANTAGRVNAGLEMVSVLQKHYEVTAPIFIDNKERVNELRPMDCQTIELEVSKGAGLTIEQR